MAVLPSYNPKSDYSAFTSLDECVKLALVRSGKNENDSLYTKFLYFAMQVVNELQADCFQNQKNLLIPVEPNLTNTGLKYAKLPDDYSQYSFVGFINNEGERIPLTYNQNMVGSFDLDDCHCGCGCCSDACKEITSGIKTTGSNVTLTTSYYTVDFGDISPLTINFYNKNGVVINDGNEYDGVALDFLFKGWGWTKIADLTYTIIVGTDIYSYFNYSIGHTTNNAPVIVTTKSAQYLNAVKVCTSSNGFITKEINTWGYVDTQTACNYTINAAGISGHYPTGAGTYTVNGNVFPIPNLTNITDANTFMLGLGFTSDNLAQPNYYMNSSTNVWTSINFPNISVNINFVQSSCFNTGVKNIVFNENICPVEVKECGCIQITQTTINSLNEALSEIAPMMVRAFNFPTLGATMTYPMTLFGYYNVDLYNKVVYLNPEYNQQAVLVTYYSLQQIDSEKYLIPYLFKDTVARYIKYCYLESKISTPQYAVISARNEYFEEKHRAKERFEPIILDEIIDLQRTKQRP